MTKTDFRSEDSKKWRSLYKTAAWLKGRAWFLRNNPLCAFCQDEGIATPATVVDHIQAHKGDRGLFHDTKNWQALCAPCHDKIKQAMERNSHKPRIDITGWPIV